MQRSMIFLCGMIAPMISAQTFVPDPLSDEYPWSDISVRLEKMFRIPASGSGPSTRMIALRQPDDGSGRIFVSDLRGKLWVWNGSGAPTVFVDLDSISVFPRFIDSPGLGTGFNSFAFHPEFASNGKFYTSHNESNASDADVKLKGGVSPRFQGVITEWTMADPAANSWNTQTGVHRELLRVEIKGTVHGLQEMAFNPTAKPGDPDYGMLYICHGDGGAYNDGAPQVGYALDTFHGGSILRIDPMGSNGRTGEYGIPADNPFADDGDENTWAEIYAWGFRNPHRISWDLGGNNVMLEGDIGEENIEEINIIEAGGHYGWPHREGTFLFNYKKGNLERDRVYSLPEEDEMDFTYPVLQYDHWSPNRTREFTAVVGGYVARNAAPPELHGKYVFGEITNGEIYFASVDEMETSEVPVWFNRLRLFDENGNERSLLEMTNEPVRVDLRFGQDLDGNIYVLSKRDGWVRKMVSMQEQTLWGPYEIQFSDGVYWADTGDWLGSVYLNYAAYGWVFVYKADRWIYLPQSNIGNGGAWVFLTRR